MRKYCKQKIVMRTTHQRQSDVRPTFGFASSSFRHASSFAVKKELKTLNGLKLKLEANEERKVSLH